MSEYRINQITNQAGTAGPQVAGITTFSSSSGLVMPSGTTEYRGGRGRGLFGGGITPSNQNLTDYITIATTGNALDFGDLNYARAVRDAACSSSTRGVFGGGYIIGTGDSNAIDYITISSTGNAFDFGDLIGGTYRDIGKVCNSTRGIWGGGQHANGSITTNIIQYVTMSTLGSASDFGDLTIDRHDTCGVQSPIRGVFSGWRTKTPTTTNTNILDYITITTLGNALDFGDMIAIGEVSASNSNTIRGLFGGGSSNSINTISYITIASLGDALDFGDLNNLVREGSSTSNSTRGVFAGGSTPTPTPALLNVIDYVTIMSTGNATDFGDLTLARRALTGCSDAHGGLGD